MIWLLVLGQAALADWPMWRGGHSRQAWTARELPADLHLQWALHLPPPRPAWPDEQGKLQFDVSYEPVAAGRRLFVPSMVADHVQAYDTHSGRPLWKFCTEGPVRFAPAVYQDNVLFVSDDGYLYCVDAKDGSLRWKHLGGPSGRKVLGNDRLVSAWPARGAPVVYDATVYYAAGIWPFMGIFVHALDIQTGQVLWTNSGSGSDYVVQQHASPAFAGVAPQGYLAVDGRVLLVSGGMTVPAAFDRRTGDLLYYRPGDRTLGKHAGGYDVMVGTSWFANRGGIYRLDDGQPLVEGAVSLVSPEGLIELQPGKLVVRQLEPVAEQQTTRDRKGGEKTTTVYSFPVRRTLSVPQQVRQVHLQAGARLFASDGRDTLYALDMPDREVSAASVGWQAKIAGHVWSMLVSDDRLFVISREGVIFCFGGGANGAAMPSRSNDSQLEPAPVADQQEDPATLAAMEATRLLQASGVRAGYAVVRGAERLELIEQLARQSDLRLVVLDQDAGRRAALRQRLESARLLGHRVSALSDRVKLPGGWCPVALPQYMASLVICRDAAELRRLISADAREVLRYQLLRPYGGVAVAPTDDQEHEQIAQQLARAKLAGAEIRRAGRHSLVRRVGSLPGSAPWTHQSADVSNSLVSPDRRVRLPLGLLWFGGPSHRDVLPRHGHGPTPQVVGGRLIIEGPHMLRAVDVYTGRLLWQRHLPDVGLYYDNTAHHPGAGGIGSNYVSLVDGIYVAYGRDCLRLDPATGETLSSFQLPCQGDTQEPPFWGYLGVYRDRLIAGRSPLLPFSPSRSRSDDKEAIDARFGEGSQGLVVLDRYRGNVLWTREATYNFRHNAIAAGDGKVFCIDRMTDARLQQLRRRGRSPQGSFRLLALDLESGDVVWETSEHVFGTWLSYSNKHNLLLQAGSMYRDRAKDEVGRGLAVYRADTGRPLWKTDAVYGGPCLLHEDTIITQDAAFDLLTGVAKTRQHPLSGEETAWRFSRNYGCSTAIGCTNLLTFRSAAAGFYDLASDGGTGNFGGFRSGCSSNLVPADGVLNAPDYTRTCNCSYQNQCSLALVHMPEAEMWTFQPLTWDRQRVRRVGINFGAPGDRRADNGTLWLDYPSVGGPSPDLPLQIEGERLRYFRYHASRIAKGEPAWVYASGVRGVRTVRLQLADGAVDPERYDVRLYFCRVERLPEPDRLEVRLQGKQVLQQFDVVAAAGEANQGIRCTFEGIEVRDWLEISFRGQTVLCGLEATLQP